MNSRANSILPYAGANLRPCALIAPSLRRAALSFKTPDDFGAYHVQPNEAGATVPPLRSMAGATLNTIMVPGSPGALPPVLFQTDYFSHVDGSIGFSSCKSEPSQEYN